MTLSLVTNPFLREMLETFVRVGGRRGGIDFDELGIQDVVELLRGDETDLPAILRDFGNRTRGEDPVIHFYEHFLAAYNKKLKIKRGIFYTPQPVVSYIVRSVHELLQTESGLEDGLASTVTWREFANSHNGVKIPEGTDPDSPFVVVLDPAVGTATFLVQAIDVIYNTVCAKWRREGRLELEFQRLWNEYVPQHLLPRLYGYELIMAPYAIAHMKIGLKLFETGYRFGSSERARVYLTNALEPPSDVSPELPGLSPALAHEAEAVNAVKCHQRFTVVIGNPPYAGISANMTDAIMQSVAPYKSINGVPLGERKIWAQDDYKKFIRFSELQIAAGGQGVLGFITNHGFINEPTSRGMRYSLLATFSRVSVLDPHGSLVRRETCPDGSPDRNVFDIGPGVVISLFRCGGFGSATATHAELWGAREAKYSYLLGHSLATTESTRVSPSEGFYLFTPHSAQLRAEFAGYPCLTDAFGLGSNGIQTSRDHVVYAFDEEGCRATIQDFRQPEDALPTLLLRERYWPGKRVAEYAPGDTRGWQVPGARGALRADQAWDARFRRALYRPFDWRTLFYADYMIDWPRTAVMSQMVHPNLSLCVGRAGGAADSREWNTVFLADTLVDMNLFYRGGNVNYPLELVPAADNMAFAQGVRPNLTSGFWKAARDAVLTEHLADSEAPACLTARNLFCYTYSVFHSPAYRTRYAEFLKTDFPRIPLPASAELFRELAALGRELAALLLVEFTLKGIDEAAHPDWPAYPTLARFVGTDRQLGKRIPGKGKALEHVIDGRGRVAINGSSYFDGVPQAVWEFHIGGYQVCHKWLDDRRKAGRSLSDEDILHYRKIVTALHETLRIMGEIDAVIERHGGWPGTFSSGNAEVDA